MNFFEVLFLQPLFNLLVFFYNTIPGNDVGLAIISVTIILKFLLLPFTVKMLKAQKALQRLQPKMQALQKQHKDNKEALGRATMELYKKEKVNPLSSCLPLLIQLPFLFAIFQVFREGFNPDYLNLLYPFVDNPGSLDHISFGFLDLAKPFLPLAILAGAAQFWQAKMLVTDKQPRVPGSKDESMTAMMNKQMTYIMPIITVVIGATLPGGLALYWFMFTLLTVAQQYLIFRPKNNDLNQEPGQVNG